VTLLMFTLLAVELIVAGAAEGAGGMCFCFSVEVAMPCLLYRQGIQRSSAPHSAAAIFLSKHG